MRPLDRYEIVRPLGAGAQGGVFLVRDRLDGGAELALKRIHAKADDLLRNSFEREFSVLASLCVRGVERVIDFGLAEPDGEDEGGPFFTRGYVAGKPLDEAVEGRTVAEVVALFVEVCAVVEPLHRAGVVHGDLKPANVVVDAEGRPHVIDFGLARLPSDRFDGGGAGTPAYMAPELLRGETPSVSGDVYALGATLFKLLTGQPPLADRGDRALSSRLAGEVPEIPADLSELERAVLAVVLRTLAPDPGQRIPAVQELRSALEERVERAAAPPASFVSPRPRGHEDVLAQIDARASKHLEAKSGEPSAVVVRGPGGSGRSTLLRELKWRLQVRGVRVLPLGSAVGGALEPLAALARHAAVLGGDEAAAALQRFEQARKGESGAEDAGTPRAEALLDAIGVAVGAVRALGPTAILVDDLDAMEPMVARALRLALHADSAAHLAVVATTTDTDAPAIAELGARHVITVPVLDVPDVAKLVEDSLGAVDISVVRALHKRTGGIAGALVDALATLAARGKVPTARDIEGLRVESGDAAARGQLELAGEAARPLANLLASSPVPVPVDLALAVASSSQDALDAALAANVVTATPHGLVLSSRSLAAVLLDDLTAEDIERDAAALLKHARSASLTSTTRAQLAVAAQDRDAMRSLVPSAAKELAATGAVGAAADLLRALVVILDDAEARSVRLELAEHLHDLARYDEAVEVVQPLVSDGGASADERARAAVEAARSLLSSGAFDRAQEILALVPENAASGERARAQRELAKVAIRRGDYAAAAGAAEAGLAIAAPDDPARIELLTSAGMVASYRDDHDDARARYREALTLAREKGSRRDEAIVTTYLAIDHERVGERAIARDLFAKSLEIARELGDIGSMASFALNLGAVTQGLGDASKAAQHYELAARLARRAGRAPTDVNARLNLANLHVYLGLYQRARAEADDALHDASEAGMKPASAQSIALLGDVAARTGDVESALARYDDAVVRYRALGQQREVVETLLDSAECLLDRNGPADGSAAVARLAEARTIIDEEGIEDYRRPLVWLLARARAENGDVDGAVTDLEAVLAEARKESDREMEWRALAAMGRLNALRGADFVGRRQDQEAMELLESIATRLPRDHRESFWHDPRRREVRRRAGMHEVSQSAMIAPRASSLGPSSLGETTFQRVGIEARVARLLELIKRLASERDVDRLLERITDSAVELAGAERGFVLLVGEDGRLAPRTVRDAGSGDTDAHAPDPHIAFSQSIAEAVLIDGEPIITIDARDDSRLSEYMSVHKLMLKSVACLPIRGRVGTTGVLYLEHRMRRGRFDEGDVDLLFAFADQAAIALENARLISENERRRAELEETNAELARAKGEIERVLVARTAELEEAKREVDRARAELRGNYSRHGIVGASDAMRRVFALIDRVRDTSVSVVIQGESGTGKELVARAIHYAGPRAEAPFVAVNCAAIPEALLESELFGHVRGAFTGADRDRRGVLTQASGGTLFLDEVGDMPGKMQVDLLRVLQDGRVRPVGGDTDERVDVRIIAASNKSLQRLVEKGEFREDLFYRLNVVELRLPPLRARPSDIPLLADHFLAQFAKRDGVTKRLTKDALKRLAEHPMPGNVRQLEHVLLNAWVLVDDTTIDADDLALDQEGVVIDLGAAERGRAAVQAAEGGGNGGRVPQTFDDFKAEEKQRILHALEEHGWNRVKAAKALDMPRRTFYRRLKEHDIL